MLDQKQSLLAKDIFKVTENLVTNIASEESVCSYQENQTDQKLNDKKFKIVKRRIMWSQEVKFNLL